MTVSIDMNSPSTTVSADMICSSAPCFLTWSTVSADMKFGRGIPGNSYFPRLRRSIGQAL